MNYISKITIIVSLLFTISCSQNKGWVYKTNDYDINTKSRFSHKTIAVLPFLDKRPSENDNKLGLYMIPLMPFGWQNFGSPETSQMHMNSGMWLNFNPKTSFSEALTEELNSASIFKEAFFSRDYRNYDYFIRGKILSTDYKGKLLSYGLSVYGPILWYIGLPASYVENHLEIELSLYRSRDKKLIFKKRYSSEPYKKTGWIYSLPSDFEYSNMLSKSYEQFIEDFSDRFN